MLLPEGHMNAKQTKAEVGRIRQTTQYTCCAASIAAALKAHGKDVTEEDLNKVLGASSMAGASWEAMLATVQYFGLRGTLVVPATPRMLKGWTDQGIPVVIAWNPEGRPWSHASVVFDVVEDPTGLLMVHIMDSNIPNPSRTTRIMDEDEFCRKWSEKVSESLIVRRPAMAIEREVTEDGRQVVASVAGTRVADRFLAAKEKPITGPGPTRRNPVVQEMNQRGWGSGTHHTRERDVAKGQSRKPKHKKDPRREHEASASDVADRYLSGAR
jgi:hypothetical protein